MPRTVKEWIGATADTPVPPRVKDRIATRADGRCEKCTTSTVAQGVEIDHKVALINWTGEGHGNRESNLWALGKKCCHAAKTKVDVAIKSVAARKRKKLKGFKVSKNPMPGSRRSPWKKKYNKHTQRFETVRRGAP